MRMFKLLAGTLIASTLAGAASAKTNLFPFPEAPGIRLVTAQSRDEFRRPVGQVKETTVTATVDKDWAAQTVHLVYLLTNGVQREAKMVLDHDYANHRIYSVCVPDNPIRLKVEARRIAATNNQLVVRRTQDDNNGQWYGVMAHSNANGFVAGAVGGKIALRSARNQRLDVPPANRLGLDQYGLCGEIYVAATAASDYVGIVYTEDKGKTWVAVPAQFAGTANQNPNVQIWSFAAPFKYRGLRKAEFYVVGTAGATQFEDANFDYNYKLAADEFVVVERW